jgi:hypothetical protein
MNFEAFVSSWLKGGKHSGTCVCHVYPAGMVSVKKKNQVMKRNTMVIIYSFFKHVLLQLVKCVHMHFWPPLLSLYVVEAALYGLCHEHICLILTLQQWRPIVPTLACGGGSDLLIFFKIKGPQARLYLKSKEYWDCQFYKTRPRVRQAKTKATTGQQLGSSLPLTPSILNNS